MKRVCLLFCSVMLFCFSGCGGESLDESALQRAREELKAEKHLEEFEAMKAEHEKMVKEHNAIVQAINSNARRIAELEGGKKPGEVKKSVVEKEK